MKNKMTINPNYTINMKRFWVDTMGFPYKETAQKLSGQNYYGGDMLTIRNALDMVQDIKDENVFVIKRLFANDIVEFARAVRDSDGVDDSLKSMANIIEYYLRKEV